MASDPRRSRFPDLAAPLAWAVALWTVLTTVAIAGATDLPYADDWEVWGTWLRQGYSLGWFFSQLNDHRIATTRLLFAISHLAFDGRGWFLQAASLAIQGLLAWLLWKLATRAGVNDPGDRRVLGAAIVSILFSGAQYMNIVWGFQVQFFLVSASGMAALGALLRAAEATRPWARWAWMAVCLLLGAACSYSMADGVLIWPVLLLAAGRLGVGRRAMGLVGAAAVAVLAHFFHGWHASLLSAPSPAWRRVVFALANAGSPIFPLASRLGGVNSGAVIAATAVGALLVPGALFHWFRAWTRHPSYSGARVALAHGAVFMAAASFALAFGRARMPFLDAFRSRYFTPPGVFWACLLAVAWPSLRTLGARRLRWAVAIAMLVCVAWHQMGALDAAREYGAKRRLASVALAAGVYDPPLLSILNHSVADLTPVIEYLKEHRLALFHQEWTHWPGQRLGARFSIDPDAAACSGGIRDAAPVGDPAGRGWRVSGWARDASGGGPRRIVLADSSGTIAGVALEASGLWEGYARGESPAVAAYGVEGDGRSLCYLGTRPLPPR